MIETTIQLKPRDQWREGMTMDALKAELDALVQVPSLTNTWIMPIKNRIDMLATGIKTPVGIKVAGPDLEVIAGIGEQIEKTLQNVPGTASAYSERVIGGRYVDHRCRSPGRGAFWPEYRRCARHRALGHRWHARGAKRRGAGALSDQSAATRATLRNSLTDLRQLAIITRGWRTDTRCLRSLQSMSKVVLV